MTEISLCIIARDDRENLAYLLGRVKEHVDELVIVDTGSIDGTRELAQEHAHVFLDGSHLLDPNGTMTDFSAARTLAHDAGTKEWQLWLDTDDDLSDPEELPVVVRTLERVRARFVRPVVGALLYEYSWNDDRTQCTQAFYRDRLVRKDYGFRWTRPVHEYIDVTKGTAIIQVPPGTLRVVHRSNGARGIEGDRNLRILQRWDADDPVRDYYLGDELFHRGFFKEAAELYTNIPPETGFYWRGMLRGSRALCNTGMLRTALETMDEAIRRCKVTNLLLERARVRILLEDWSEAEADLLEVARRTDAGEDLDPSEDPTTAFDTIAQAIATYRRFRPHTRLPGHVDVHR